MCSRKLFINQNSLYVLQCAVYTIQQPPERYLLRCGRRGTCAGGGALFVNVEKDLSCVSDSCICHLCLGSHVSYLLSAAWNVCSQFESHRGETPFNATMSQQRLPLVQGKIDNRIIVRYGIRSSGQELESESCILPAK